ncbi:DUF1648 domain-containing protein [Nocardioides sp. SYSU D00065]|uniref:DUF1648 domain-containing protein n=1 Tax=Nocardioides sp. SYSU D00065 TaxID=2817378 RepID=UPI001B31BC47|nr:DUF1648 domain-containing protein [Nocardioides sp. SYSU D00065]
MRARLSGGRPGRLALLVTAAAYVVALAWAAAVLPERVPSHFDAAGRVDDWSSRPAALVAWAGIGVLVLGGIPLLTRALSAGDGRWVNLPPGWKDHWFAPERRAEFRDRLQDDTEASTALTGVLLLAVLGLTTWVGTTGRDEVPWWVLAGLVGGYLALTAAWALRVRARYRPPGVS